MSLLHKHLERNRALILASEVWAPEYDSSPETLGRLLKVTARMERRILEWMRSNAKNVDRFIKWDAYRYARYEIKATRVDAYDVQVIVDDAALDDLDTAFITVVFEEIAVSTALGAQAGEITYRIPLGLDVSDAQIQRIAKEQVAELVGKRVTKDGLIIDNPRAEYRISDKVRADIKESIQTSLSLGDDVPAARDRLMTTIKDSRRAEMIAQTETVNSYNKGLSYFGQRSGAIGKEWRNNGATDICAVNSGDGVIPFGTSFSSGHSEPTAHPRCRCYLRLVYQNELDKNPDLFG